MHLSITRLVLNRFRNHPSFDMSFPASHIAIVGKNGAGKTNILEAISLLAPGKGLRSARLSDMESYDADPTPHTGNWSVFASLNTPAGDVSIGTGKTPEDTSDKRRIKINGEPVSGQTELSQYLSVCALTPQMDHIFAEGISSRRHYMDQLTGQFYPDHIRHLSIYNHARTERMKLLQRGNADPIWLDSLEKRMSEHTFAIAAARRESIALLQQSVDAMASSFPKARLEAKGEVETLLATHSSLEAEDRYREMLTASRRSDQQTGRTEHGSHRSDFIAIHESTHLPAEYCSTGEQKALLLTITLATARAKQQWFGVSPLMLLDEVASHLDETKRDALFLELQQLNSQCWMTDTDERIFMDFPSKIHVLTIEKSNILGYSQPTLA